MARAVCVLSLVLLWAAVSTACASRVPPPRLPSDATLTAMEAQTIAQELARRGDLTRAEQYALLAIERGAARRQLLPLLVQVCLRASRLSAALEHAWPALHASPDDRHLRYLVATLYAALARPLDAQREVTHLLRDEPNDARALALQRVLQRMPSERTTAEGPQP